MESADNFKGKELEQLIEFVNSNSPLPQQSVDETLNQLDKHTKATCLEISENLTTLCGEEMQRYVDWVNHRFYDINSHGYQMEIHRQTSVVEARKEIGFKTDPLPPSKRYPLSDIIDENMTPEEKKERLDFSLRITGRYLKEINEVIDYLTEHHQMAKEVEVVTQDKEEYISTSLERRHQNLYSLLIDGITGDIKSDIYKEDYEDIFFRALNFCVNQENEIDNNFYNFSADITGPYLVQMHKLFSEKLLKLGMSKESFPLWHTLRMVLSTQLSGLCRHVESLQEQQAKNPYLENFNEMLLDAGSFARFLLLEKKGMISGIKNGPGNEEVDIKKAIAYSMGIDEARVGLYLEIIKEPITSWRKKYQREMKLVEEYLERLSGMKEYEYE